MYETIEKFHEALTHRSSSKRSNAWSSMSDIEYLGGIQKATIAKLDTESISSASLEGVTNNIKVLELASGQIQNLSGN